MNFKAGSVLLLLVVLSPCANAAQAVFANGLEVAAKRAGAVTALPDVAFAPEADRLPPGVPIPYPNIIMMSDMDQGSTAARRTLPKAARYGRARDEETRETQPVEMPRQRGFHFERHSFDVKLEQPAEVRLPDLSTRNHG